MSILSHIRLFYGCHFSKPPFNRPVYKAIKRNRAKKIVEFGLGTGQRAIRMIEVAQLCSPQQIVHYVGIDPFEGRSESDGPGLTLKATHQLLRSEGALVELHPGNPSDVLPRIANSLGKVDLLIVPADLDSKSHARFWFFVPRMLHDQSLVFVERRLANDQRTLEIKSRGEIDGLASLGVRRRAA